ncbi:prepilin peptidase [Candidatus Saccharibacteria bacterium]|nr:prepilin peptidase [Candidatus Saccharibacteria bacterium]
MFPQIVFFTFYFLLGAAVGSFLDVWARRLLRGEAPTGRSRCEHCGRKLSTIDLVPLLSFFALRGRCRYCKKPLSWRYPLVEGATGVIFALLAWKLGFPTSVLELLTLAVLFVAVSSFIVIVLTDLTEQTIFDQTLWVALLASAIYRILQFSAHFLLRSLLYDLLGALGIFALLLLIRIVTHERGMGEADPPLGFLVGLLVGFPLSLLTLFLAFVLGGLAGSILILTKRKKLKDRVAFGPFLVSSAFLAFFFGQTLINWYLNLLFS